MKTMDGIQLEIREWLSNTDDLEAYEPEVRAEIEESMLSALEELAEQEKEKVDDYGFVFCGIENEIEYLKGEREKIDGKIKSLQNKYDRIKERLKFIMLQNNLKKLNGHVHTISLRTSTAVVVEADPRTLPPECQRVIPEKVEPDRAEIKRYLETTGTIPGCKIETRQSVVIK